MRVTKYFSKRNTEENLLNDDIKVISVENCICQLFNHINSYNKGKIIQVNEIIVKDYNGEYKGHNGVKLVTIAVDLEVDVKIPIREYGCSVPFKMTECVDMEGE